MASQVANSIRALADVWGKKPKELSYTEIHNLFMSSPVTVDIYAALIYNKRDKKQLKVSKITALEAIEDIPDWILDTIIEDLCKQYVKYVGEQAFYNIINHLLYD